MKRKLKVLQVGKYYPPVRGGIETHLELLSEGLQEKVDLKVIVANEAKHDLEEIVNGVAVRRMGTFLKAAGAPFCPGLRQALRHSDADIVHIHTPHPTALLTYLLSGCQGQLVCTYHSDIVRQKYLGKIIEPLQDLAFRRAGAIVAASPNLIESSPVLSRHRARCEMIPFGLDIQPFNHPDAALVASLRAQFAGPIALAVGRLVYYKGFEFLVRAMAQVPEPMSLLIIGDGPLRGKLQTTIDELGLHERVHLLGNVTDTVPYYHACDFFVLPSIARSEAFGIVQLEAMACGKPVINTQLTTGVPFVSPDGESGIAVPPADANALAAAIRTLVSDQTTRRRLGAAGRRRVEEKFTVARMIESMLALYHRIAK